MTGDGGGLRPPFDHVHVVRARIEELDEVLGILAEAARWLHDRGIHQWPAAMPERMVRPELEAGNCHLARDGDAAVGTLTLQETDERFWGVQPPEALYLHRLAVLRSHRGLGRQLLDWAESTTRDAGRRYLRLDCMSENPGVRGFYERAGYVHRGEIADPRWRASLYERDLSA